MSSCVGPSSLVISLFLPLPPWPHFTDGFLGIASVNVQLGQAPRGSGMENQDCNTYSLPTAPSSGTEHESSWMILDLCAFYNVCFLKNIPQVKSGFVYQPS